MLQYSLRTPDPRHTDEHKKVELWTSLLQLVHEQIVICMSTEPGKIKNHSILVSGLTSGIVGCFLFSVFRFTEQLFGEV